MRADLDAVASLLVRYGLHSQGTWDRVHLVVLDQALSMNAKVFIDKQEHLRREVEDGFEAIEIKINDMLGSLATLRRAMLVVASPKIEDAVRRALDQSDDDDDDDGC